MTDGELAEFAREQMRSRVTFRRMKATMGGYFWLPCPSCGLMFGGNESADTGKESSVPDPAFPKGSGRGLKICPVCTLEGRGYVDSLESLVEGLNLQALDNRDLALRTQYLQDQVDGAADHQNADHFKEVALALCDCLDETYRRNSMPIPDDVIEFRRQVNAGVYREGL